MPRTEPGLTLTGQESDFIAQFDREARSGASGPAFAWLEDHELDPALLVAFQWALEPEASLRPGSTEPLPAESFVAPWPTADALRARVDEIVAAYPWLEAYTRAADPAPASQAPHRDDGTVGQVPIYRLIRGRWYVGRGRNGNVGLWDGRDFLVIAEKFGRFVVKEEPYFAATSGCFQPFREVDEGRMAEPFGGTGWDAHYGRRMTFGPGEAPEATVELRATTSEPVRGWARPSS